MPSIVTPSMENYLESIYGLSKDGASVRVKELAANMGVKMASVTGALQNLAQNGLVYYAPYKPVVLSGKGLELARCIANRHLILTRFLKETLGIRSVIAEQDACKLEHVLSRETMDGLLKFMVRNHFISVDEKSSIDYFEEKKER